jgi:AraC-like DNA-binding protein
MIAAPKPRIVAGEIPERGSDAGREPAMVVALVRRAEHRQHLRELIREVGAVMFCAYRWELTTLVARGEVTAVVLEPIDAAGAIVEPEVRALRARFPSVPVFIYCDMTPASVNAIPILTRAGADDLVLGATADGESDAAAASGATLRRAIATATLTRAATAILDELTSGLPPSVEPIVGYCVREGRAPLTVERMARDLGVHRRTLVNRLAAADYPSPQHLIAWARLLLAARLLEDPGRSVAATATALGFGSAAALRGMLQRYVGLRPSEVRRAGGARYVLELLRAEVERGRGRGRGRGDVSQRSHRRRIASSSGAGTMRVRGRPADRGGR